MGALDVLAEGAREGAYPGGQLAASREGQRLALASVGVLGPGLDAARDDSLYDLASLTKPLATTVLVGRAVERGLLRLQDPLGSYVPGVDPEITIERVLDHSSGLPAHARFDQELSCQIRPGTWSAFGAIIEKAAGVPRERPSGETAVYSDIGFILLGAALEAIYARPLSAEFARLGTEAFFLDRRGPPAAALKWPEQTIAPTEGCAPGEVHDENARCMGGAAGHAGLFGTALAVLKIAEDLVAAYHGQKGGLLEPSTVRLLWTPSHVCGSTWAFGWDRPARANSSTGGRWPNPSVGHLGFTGTSLWIEPERALIVVLVTNRVCPTRENSAIRRLRPALYDAAWEEWSSPCR